MRDYNYREKWKKLLTPDVCSVRLWSRICFGMPI